MACKLCLFFFPSEHSSHFSFSSSRVSVKCQSSLLDCKLLEGSGCVLVLIEDPEGNTVPRIYKMLIRDLLNEYMKQTDVSMVYGKTWLPNQKHLEIFEPCLWIEYLSRFPRNS